MLQTSLRLMKSLNETETHISLSVMCSLFPKVIFLTFNILSPFILSSETHPILSVILFILCYYHFDHQVYILLISQINVITRHLYNFISILVFLSLYRQ